MDSPKVRPYSGVVSEYTKLPPAPFDLYSHGQNKKTSSSASPKPPPSKSQRATPRSARFSAWVPSTGQRGSLKTVSTPSILPPRVEQFLVGHRGQRRLVRLAGCPGAFVGV